MRSIFFKEGKSNFFRNQVSGVEIYLIPEYGLLDLSHDPLQVSLVFILILFLIIIMMLITFLFYLNSNCFHSLHIKSVLLLNLNKLIG